MSASLYGIPDSFEKPIAAGGAAVCDADDQVCVRGCLLREALAHPHARAMHLDASDLRVGPREVHVLEDAERAPRGGDGLRGVQTLGVDPDDLARLHVADDLGADEVERARLGRDRPVVAQSTERERTESARVAKRNERVVHDRGHRVRALEPSHRVRHRFDERGRIASEERCYELRVRSRRHPDAVGEELATKLLDIHEIPVVAECNRPCAPVMDVWLRVRPLVRTGGRVARVTDRNLAGQRLQLLLVEDVREEANLAYDRQATAVRDRDPGRLLAAVLEREQPEVRET